jgi:AcrR family transcriptional regulator
VAIEKSTETEPRRPLTRERVLRAAIALADRDGIEALSMRKLGQELGVDAMAMYRHVRSKDDMLDGVVELIVGEFERPPAGENWKATLRQHAMAARRVMLKHPWARRVLEERGTSGPASLAHIEAVLATMLGAGFSMEVAHHALHVMDSRIFGFNQALFEDSGPADLSPEAEAAIVRALAGYPRISELAQAASHEGVLGRCDDDVEFAFGLDLILDGLERFRQPGVR